MNKTKIEWVKSPDGTQGYTWNPITGCLNHDNGLCKGGGFPCYAYRLANGRLKFLYLSNSNTAPREKVLYDDPFYPRFWEDRMPVPVNYQNPAWSKKPRGIFVCDMGDLFGIGIPEKWTKDVLRVIRFNPHHRFYLLTKQPQNLVKWSPFPPNVDVGVTVTSDGAMTLALTRLAGIEASIKYLSIEPLLGAISMKSHDISIVNQVIVGAQTRPTVFPRIEWVREIVEACDKAGVAVFLKDNLRPLLTSTLNGKDIIESHNLWAFKDFKLRQEMPCF